MALTRPRPAPVAIGVVVAAGIALFIDALGDATQTRPDRLVPGSRTVIELQMSTRDGSSAFDAARALWVACGGDAEDVTPVGDHQPDRYLAEAEPAMGPNAMRKVRGCLEDLTLDRILADVVSVAHHHPSPQQPGP